jgi:hypothetical protein
VPAAITHQRGQLPGRIVDAHLDQATPRIVMSPGPAVSPAAGSMISDRTRCRDTGSPSMWYLSTWKKPSKGWPVSSISVSHFIEATAYQAGTTRRSGYPWYRGSSSPFIA